MHKVYLVQGTDGCVFAIFHSKEDAQAHQSSFPEQTKVIERTVFTGQANYPGYNR